MDIAYILEELSNGKDPAKRNKGELEKVLCSMCEDTVLPSEEVTQEFLIQALQKKVRPVLHNYQYMKKNYGKLLEKSSL